MLILLFMTVCVVVVFFPVEVNLCRFSDRLFINALPLENQL